MPRDQGKVPSYVSAWKKGSNNGTLPDECSEETGHIGSKNYLFQEARKRGLFTNWEIKPIQRQGTSFPRLRDRVPLC